MNTIDWNIDSDKENIREGAVELRKQVSENMYIKLFETPEKAEFQVNNDRTFWRRSCLEKVELIFNRKLSGTVLEIGAGSGWCSSLLSKRKEIDQLYVLDYDQYSVEELFPLVAKNLDADQEKMTGVIGSYNKMKLDDNSIDYIISIGAIHHSENLDATYRECHRVLKPGGVLIAVEHCHPNSYQITQETNENEAYIDPKRAKMLYGDENLKIKTKDNSDHNYRICQFETASIEAGFNTLPFIFNLDGEEADDSMFQEPKPYRSFAIRTFQPYFVKSKIAPAFDNLLIVSEKLKDGKFYVNDLNESKPRLSQKRTFTQKVISKLKALGK